MHHPLCRLAVLLGVATTPAFADQATEQGWSGSGELGLAVSRGNARSENLNAALKFKHEDGVWRHRFSLAALRAKGEVESDSDGNGVPERRFVLNANRYELGASSAIRMNERAYWIGALRHERDDFASFDRQTSFALNFGYAVIDDAATTLGVEAGPGYRRTRDAATGSSQGEAIFRAQIDFEHAITPNTTLGNIALVESGADNTFFQNDFGLKVAMNSKMALKAGIQLRHNSEVDPGTERTDTLTTLNLVYSFR